MAVNRTRQVEGLSIDIARESPTFWLSRRTCLYSFLDVGRRATDPDRSFWWRYLSRHDWYWTVAQLGLLIAISESQLPSFSERWRVARSGGRRRQPKKDKHIIRQALFGSACGLVIFAGYVFLSYGAIEGARPGYDSEMDILETASLLSWLPWTYAQVHLDPFAELKDEALSTKSEHWTEKSPLEHIKGASLQGRDLRYGNLRNAYLVKADLSHANLSKADLSGADLRLANLRGATLEGATLSGANLTGAELKEVKGLTQAQLLTTKKDREGTPAPDQLAAQPARSPETLAPVEAPEPVASPNPAEEDVPAPEQLTAQPEAQPERLPETLAPVEASEPVASPNPAEENVPAPEQLTAQPEKSPETLAPVEAPEPVASPKPAEENVPAPEQLTAQPEVQPERSPETLAPVEAPEPVASPKPAEENVPAPEQLTAQPDRPSPVEAPEPVASTKPAEEDVPAPAQLPAQPKTRSIVEAPEPIPSTKPVEEDVPASEPLAAQTDPASTGKQNMRVSKNQSPPSGKSNAIEGSDSTVSKPNGNNNTPEVSQLDPNHPVKLGVFTKPADEGKVVTALRPLGYDMWEIESSVPEGQTNMIWFGAQVQEKDVRRVALALVCADVTIKGIGPFPKNNKPNRIEVGYNKYLESSPHLTFTEIINMEFPTIPASPTEDFSWLKDCP